MHFFALETPVKLPTVATVTRVREDPVCFFILISHGLVDCDLKYIMCFRAVTVATVAGFLRLSDPYFCNTFSASCDSCLRHCNARLGTPRLTSKPRLAGLIEGGWVKSGGLAQADTEIRMEIAVEQCSGASNAPRSIKSPGPATKY
jgi:hypothetical protein